MLFTNEVDYKDEWNEYQKATILLNSTYSTATDITPDNCKVASTFLDVI